MKEIGGNTKTSLVNPKHRRNKEQWKNNNSYKIQDDKNHINTCVKCK